MPIAYIAPMPSRQPGTAASAVTMSVWPIESPVAICQRAPVISAPKTAPMKAPTMPPRKLVGDEDREVPERDAQW